MKIIKKFFLTVLLSLTIFLSGCVSSLTVEKLNRMIEEKTIEELSWDDFKNFRRQADYTNNKVWIYELDDGSTLILSGKKDSKKPNTISVIEVGGESVYLKNENE